MSQIDVRRSVVNSSGRRIHVLADDPRGDALVAAGGDFNPGSLAMWSHLLSLAPWDLVIDVGANYGEMLLGVDLPPAARVVAFEPDDAVRACLERSIQDAGIAVEVRPEAVSAVVGEAEFVVDPTWSGTSALAEVMSPASRHRRVIRVPTTTLDACFADSTARRACIKVDVEGAEDLVLKGGAQVMDRFDDVGVLVEILHRSGAELVEWADTWRLYVFDLRRRELIRVGPGDAPAIDLLLEQKWIYRQDAVLRQRVEQ